MAIFSSPLRARTSAVHRSPAGVLRLTSVWASQPQSRAVSTASCFSRRWTSVSGFQSHFPLALWAKNRVPSLDLFSTAWAGQHGILRCRFSRARPRNSSHFLSVKVLASIVAPYSSTHRKGIVKSLGFLGFLLRWILAGGSSTGADGRRGQHGGTPWREDKCVSAHAQIPDLTDRASPVVCRRPTADLHWRSGGSWKRRRRRRAGKPSTANTTSTARPPTKAGATSRTLCRPAGTSGSVRGRFHAPSAAARSVNVFQRHSRGTLVTSGF